MKNLYCLLAFLLFFISPTTAPLEALSSVVYDNHNKEIILKNQFALFPNPVSVNGDLRGQLDHAHLNKSWFFETVDRQGKLLGSGELRENNIALSDLNIPAGLHYFIIRNKDYIFSEQFVVY